MEMLGDITLHAGDCMDIMRKMLDNEYDLAIIDPPYGIGEDGHKAHTRSNKARAQNYNPFYGNDKCPESTEYFKELFRVSKNQIIWGANHFISRIPFDSPCWVVWDKSNGNNDFADCELAWTSFNTAVRKLKFRWAGMLQENMKHKEIRIHPTQKPVALYKWLLSNYAQPGDRILDTHGGSMSIAIACHDMGYELTVIEKDPYYYAAARKRLIDHQTQTRLF